ncbi:MAG TPA: magnesium-translocating P-type ATPase [Candidatus Limnocylindria bacterium]
MPDAMEHRGLTTGEAARLLARDGPNETLELGRASPLRELLRTVTSPLILILLFASVVSGVVGEIVNAVVIAAMVVMGAVLGWWQSVRAHRATERLRLMVAPTAMALRDGVWRQIARRELVVGDVVRLNAGDVVPADARLVESRDLHVQEAILTGESVPAEKGVAAAALAGPRTERSDIVYLGTSITSGTATAVVFATGHATEVGTIAASLARPAPETAFDRGTRQFGFFIMRLVLFLVAFVSIVNIALHRDPLDSILFAIALAVGLTPEYMPMIMTVTLAKGASGMAKAGVIVKSLGAIQNLGSMDVLCSDKTNTLTTGELVLERCVPMAGTEGTLLRLAAINAAFQSGIDSALDAAILARARLDTTGLAKVDEVPFDFDRRRLSVVVECEGKRLIITKGAPEDMIALCAIDDATRRRALATIDELSDDGLRVLAVASREVEARSAYGAEEERGLVLDGFLAFADPPIEGVAATLAALRADGVELKVLSGDHVLVARHVCGQLGIAVDTIVDGDALDAMDDRALAAAVRTTSVYARVRPEQKQRVISALRREGHVVGYLGDGVNDAPSMHVADIGISVERGVDTAKEAADVILHGTGLEVLHEGILAGRRAFGNVVKYLLMGTSSDFGNMISMAVASVVLPFLPMLPRQILLNDLMYDVTQMAIPTDAVDPSYVRKPRRWDIGLVRRFMLTLGPVSSLYDLATFAVLMWLFDAKESLFQTGWFVESLATQTLVVFVIRTTGNPFRSRPSRPLAVAVVLVVAVAIALPFSPLATDFGLVPLPATYLGLLVVMVGSYLALVELVKRRVFARTERAAV